MTVACSRIYSSCRYVTTYIKGIAPIATTFIIVDFFESFNLKGANVGKD